MKRVPIVYRHFPGVIELGAVDDDFRLQFCGEPRARMKRRHIVHRAIVRRSDVHRHFVCVRVLPAIETNVRLSLRTH